MVTLVTLQGTIGICWSIVLVQIPGKFLTPPAFACLQTFFTKPSQPFRQLRPLITIQGTYYKMFNGKMKETDQSQHLYVTHAANQQQQQQQQQRQQQPPPDGVVQQEFTSVHRAGVAGPPPGNISWSHMPPQPGHPNYQHMQPPPPQQQQHQYQMQQGSLQPQQQPGMPPTQAQMTRLDRLKRWKEKRKNRVFTKSIRYMSRKVCADNRPRIKGKFVKVSSLSSLTDIAENNDDEEKMKKKEDEGKDSKPDDGKGEPREKAKSEEANDLIRDLREKAIEAGLGAGKPLSRLRRNNAHSSAPNLASLADMH